LPSDKSKITLTFDNGPDPQVTPAVLECLARHSVNATFFVMGRKASTGRFRFGAPGEW